jgi:hypothetical protein
MTRREWSCFLLATHRALVTPLSTVEALAPIIQLSSPRASFVRFPFSATTIITSLRTTFALLVSSWYSQIMCWLSSQACDHCAQQRHCLFYHRRDIHRFFRCLSCSTALFLSCSHFPSSCSRVCMCTFSGTTRSRRSTTPVGCLASWWSCARMRTTLLLTSKPPYISQRGRSTRQVITHCHRTQS